MSIAKEVVSIFHTGEEKPIVRYKVRIQIGEDPKYIINFFQKYILIDFLGLNGQTKKFVLGSFDLKLHRLAKVVSVPGPFPISI